MRGIICPISEQVVSFAVLSYSFLSRCSLSPPSSCFRESQDGVRRSGVRLSCFGSALWKMQYLLVRHRQRSVNSLLRERSLSTFDPER